MILSRYNGLQGHLVQTENLLLYLGIAFEKSLREILISKELLTIADNALVQQLLECKKYMPFKIQRDYRRFTVGPRSTPTPSNAV